MSNLKNEKNTIKEKKRAKESISNKDRSFKDILKAAPELPTGIAYMRGMWKKQKPRCSSQKRKR